MSGIGLVLAVALAGGLGAALRYVVDNAVPARVRERFPWGTQVVNLTGSFALGLLTGLLSGDSLSVLGVGLLGGYTTFSAASLEAVGLATDRRYGAALAHGLGMLVACVVAAALGLWVGEIAVA